VILYHGSYKAIEKPDLSFARLQTDFGKGFYLTPIRSQAEKWAERFHREHGTATLSIYEFLSTPGEKLPPDLKILEFDSHNIEWLNFITACRLGKPVDTGWYLVIGGVANDRVFDTIQLYFENLISAEDAIGRLRYNKPNFQYCIKTQSLIDNYLQFKGAEVLI
jgi:hypothetical protein